jgi:hypothetical protein
LARLFGFEIKRQQPGESEAQSFAPPIDEDGGVVLTPGGFFGSYVDLDNAAKNETDLVTRYRDLAQQSEIEMAVDEITNEAICATPENHIVGIVLADVEASDKIKGIIEDEFENVIKLLKFNAKAYEIFRQWYIDGRLFYHAIVDEKAPQDGIKELRYIDPRSIKKVKEVKKPKIITRLDNEVIKSVNVAEYFIYSTSGFDTKDYNPRQMVKIAKDSIVYLTSGLTDRTGQMVLSHLHKAVKPMNQLRIMEDATVIYRISRAPERRVFYVDVGNLPKMKAEQYLRDMMVKHKNRLIYNAETGDVKDDRKFMTMVEDYWMPRREGGRGTEITTLKGGENLGVMEDVLYFQKKLYQSLNIPVSRLYPETPFSSGNINEVSNEEMKFFKFIQRLRSRFSMLFTSILEKNLMLKNIMTYEDWDAIKDNIRYDFVIDNNFAEARDNQILKERINMANLIDPMIGRYYSEEYVRRFILKQHDEDIEQINMQNEKEFNVIAERRLKQAQVDGEVQLAQQEAATPQQPEAPQDGEAPAQGDQASSPQGDELPDFLRGR